jgi:hypothetical protein
MMHGGQLLKLEKSFELAIEAVSKRTEASLMN